jgi:hypothetical protein
MHLAGIPARRKLGPGFNEGTAMKQFQKIAIGILGLKHPELFLTARTMPSHDSTGHPLRRAEGRVIRAVREFQLILAALAIGSRTLGLADNSQLRRDLSARARLLYGSGEG